MKSTVRVAAVSAESHPARTEANLDTIRRCARKAAEQGADLVLFPELSVTGFVPNHPVGDHAQWLREVLQGAWAMAEPLNGPAVRELAAISAETGVFLAAGLLENAGNVLFNTHVLAGEGRVYAHWRKMHIPMFEMQVYNGGGVPEVVDTPLGRIGANICFDTLLPESTRLLAVQGCEIALFPFAADPAPGTAEAWAAWARPVLQARCAENGIYGAACNYLGSVSFAGASQSFPGGAMTLAPGGQVLAEGAAELLLTDFTAQGLLDARAAFEYTFRFRRPELYGSLTR
ncbi:carbon-nitrogen hydrolase family protein [Paludibaculum fermentans]|uniref:Carbon-nitrogen hydrolase family protein n=1 Tax=Paludibaculum fermentans TaxID=1473598 RepID=A0A7S7SL14_PALFE|nr:carbon-nitrogen hydrolase family protein [Paludibaculum fermentans]QOY88914.1 carbon-nitrogen hydrolase family protein [Paludibaculum fermentans]